MLGESLQPCSGDLQALKDVLARPLQQSKSVVNRFRKIVNNVFNEKELRKLALRLGGRKLTISVFLSSLGRW